MEQKNIHEHNNILNNERQCRRGVERGGEGRHCTTQMCFELEIVFLRIARLPIFQKIPKLEQNHWSTESSRRVALGPFYASLCLELRGVSRLLLQAAALTRGVYSLYLMNNRDGVAFIGVPE